MVKSKWQSLTTDDPTDERDVVALGERADSEVQPSSPPVEHDRMLGRNWKPNNEKSVN